MLSVRSSLEPGPLGSSDSPCEPRHLASIPPGPSFPAFLPSEAGTTETPRQGGGQSRCSGGASAGQPQRPLPQRHPRRPRSCLRASARWGFSSSVWGDLFLPSAFSGGATQALARRPGLPLGSLPMFCSLGALAMSLETCVRCLPHPSPSQGPSWPPTVTLPPALSSRSSYLDPSGGCVLLPPHPAHPPVPSWAPVPALHGIWSSACRAAASTQPLAAAHRHVLTEPSVAQ